MLFRSIGKGILQSTEKLCVIDNEEKVIPADIGVTARWNEDKSIKCLGVSFEADIKGGKGNDFFLIYNNDFTMPEKESGNIIVNNEKDYCTVSTRKLEFGIDKKEYRVFDYVKRDGNRIIDNAGERGFFVITGNGKIYDSKWCKEARITIEEHGNIRAVIRAEGQMESEDGEGL